MSDACYIDLGPAADDIRPHIPCPSARPAEQNLWRIRQAPSHTWPVIMSGGRPVGYLCRHVYGEVDNVSLAVYGENPGKILRWSFKPVPALAAEIDRRHLKVQPDATIVIVPPGEADPADFEGDVVFVPGIIFTGDLFGPSLPPAQHVSSQNPVAGQVSGSPTQPGTRQPASGPPPAVSIAASCNAGIRDEPSELDEPATPTTTIGTSKTPKDDQCPQTVSCMGLERSSPSSTITRASDLTLEPIQWIWPKVVAVGKITLLAGEAGLGKSMLAAALAASVSTGSPWPESSGNGVQGDVVLIAPEDDPNDTLTPRLIAAGANLHRIHIQNLATGQDLVSALRDLDERLPELGNVRLLIVDPITACLGRYDLNRTGDMRRVLMPLTEWAHRTGIAVVLISHMNKAIGRSPLGRILGSQAFAAVARAVFLVCPDPSDADRRLVLPIKDNIGVDREGLAFRITQQTVSGGLDAPRAVFDDVGVALTASEVLASLDGGSKEHSAIDEAKEFLFEVLKDGPTPADTIIAAARSAGISLASLRRAKSALHVTVHKGGMSAGWRWTLPVAAKMLNDRRSSR